MRYILLLCLLVLCQTGYTARNNGTRILLDAELNDWMQSLVSPLIQVSDTPSQTISIFIAMDDQVNAFATPNRALFFNTGLITRATDEEEVRGVMAHELGHILGNHHIERYEDIKGMTTSLLTGALLGLGATLAGGGGDAAVAGILGGQAFGQSKFLSNSRTQEREADQIGITLLQKSGYSVQGMVSFFQKLYSDSLLMRRQAPDYLQTHPLPAERLDTLKATQEKENPNSNDGSIEGVHRFSRIQAKTFAFTHTPTQTLRKYRGQTTADKLAQAMAYTYQGKLDKALTNTASLLQQSPKDPYLHELKGHIYLEQGNLTQAANSFETALTYSQNPLLHYHYGRTLQAQEKHQQAIDHFLAAILTFEDWSELWYATGISYGKLGKLGESHISLAEYSLRRNDVPTAKQHLKRALEHIPEKSRLAQQAKMLQQSIEDAENK